MFVLIIQNEHILTEVVTACVHFNLMSCKLDKAPKLDLCGYRRKWICYHSCLLERLFHYTRKLLLRVSSY